MTLLEVVLKLAFVVDPLLLQIVEVCIVEWVIKHRGVVVVDLSRTVELVVFPVALVCQLAIRVVKLAIAIHGIIDPLAFISATLIVEKLAISVFFLVFHIPFIPRATLILLDYILWLSFLFHLYTSVWRIISCEWSINLFLGNWLMSQFFWLFECLRLIFNRKIIVILMNLVWFLSGFWVIGTVKFVFVVFRLLLMVRIAWWNNLLFVLMSYWMPMLLLIYGFFKW